MTPSHELSARQAIQVTRAAPLFDRLAETVVEHRASLPRLSANSWDNARLEAVRERLDWFFPKFRDLYFKLLRQHIGPDLPQVLEALNDDSVQRYLRALESMRPALLEALQQLGREMVSSLDAP